MTAAEVIQSLDLLWAVKLNKDGSYTAVVDNIDASAIGDDLDGPSAARGATVEEALSRALEVFSGDACG